MTDQATKPGTPVSRWRSAVTHLLDELAEAAGLEIDRHALIESYNDLSDECKDQPSTREAVARAICKAMNINPDGFNHAHRFRTAQDLIANGRMWTIRNWQAAEHLAVAAMEAISDGEA